MQQRLEKLGLPLSIARNLEFLELSRHRRDLSDPASNPRDHMVLALVRHAEY